MGKDLDRFTTKLPDHLHCPVCLEAAYPPVVACSSEHTLCEECAGNLARGGGVVQCPTCREVIQGEFKVSPGLKRLVESYGYRCDKQDCIWVGSVADADAIHRLECVARNVGCSKCYEVHPFNRKAQHEAECPAAVLFCPRGGPDCGGETGGGTRIRCRMSEHTRTCTSYQCKVDGCTTRTTLAHLAAHETACRALHDKLAAAETSITKLAHERNALEEDNALATSALENLRTGHAQELAALRMLYEAENEALRRARPVTALARANVMQPFRPASTTGTPHDPLELGFGRFVAERLDFSAQGSKKHKRG